MQAYHVHIQSLNALIAQLLAAQKQQEQPNSTLIPARELIKCDVAVQSEPPSPHPDDNISIVLYSRFVRVLEEKNISDAIL